MSGSVCQGSDGSKHQQCQQQHPTGVGRKSGERTIASWLLPCGPKLGETDSVKRREEVTHEEGLVCAGRCHHCCTWVLPATDCLLLSINKACRISRGAQTTNDSTLDGG